MKTGEKRHVGMMVSAGGYPTYPQFLEKLLHAARYHTSCSFRVQLFDVFIRSKIKTQVITKFFFFFLSLIQLLEIF
jgi:hypothetical protein